MKIVLSIVVTALLALVYKLASPPVTMATQDVIVNQMSNTDSSTAAVMYVGNGINLLSTGCLVAWVVLMGLIWGSTIVRAVKNNKQ